MEITWDADRAASNFQKYGVRFSDVQAIISGYKTLVIENKPPADETSFIAMGVDHLFRLAVISYYAQDDDIQITSARLATHSEKKTYGSRI